MNTFGSPLQALNTLCLVGAYLRVCPIRYAIADAVEENLFVFKAINRMIIHHPDGLHKRITNRGADKVKAAFL